MVNSFHYDSFFSSISSFTEVIAGHLCLHGQTNFGDSIEDEWLIVYLLRELSLKFKDLWIRVSDADGEFLLVEAANALPRWLVPEIAEKRVCAPFLAFVVVIANVKLLERYGFIMERS